MRLQMLERFMHFDIFLLQRSHEEFVSQGHRKNVMTVTTQYQLAILSIIPFIASSSPKHGVLHV
jgi:hypothetical protein